MRIKFEQLMAILNLLPIGILLINDQKQIVYMNKASAGFLPSEVTESSRITGFLPYDFLKSKKTFIQTRIGDDLKIQLEFKHLTGTKLDLITLYDVTQLDLAEYRNHFYEAILDSIDMGIHALDANGNTIIYNKYCENHEGLSRKDVIGKHVTEIHKVTLENSIQLNVLKTGKPTTETEVIYYTKGDKQITLASSSHPIFDDGKIVGVFSTSRDITAMKDLTNKNIMLQSKLLPSEASEDNAANSQNHSLYTFEQIIHKSPLIDRLIAQARKAANTCSPLMICGETGTGKELFVQSIHQASSRRNEPFIAINCAAIPVTLLESILFGTVKGAFTGALNTPGLFEQAGRGTLFLDEINSMDIHLQVKLLRVLQEKVFRRISGKNDLPVNCRIVSASNIDPFEAVNKGILRKDLYYRLTAVLLTLPPLRERKEDIPVLCNHFLQKYNKQLNRQIEKISPNLLDILVSYSWPGNVRELEHVIESAMNMAGEKEYTLMPQHLPTYFLKKVNAAALHTIEQATLPDAMAAYERQLISNALTLNHGNISRAAEYLGIYRQSLQRKIKQLGIKY